MKPKKLIRRSGVAWSFVKFTSPSRRVFGKKLPLDVAIRYGLEFAARLRTSVPQSPGADAGYFSRMKSGAATLQADKIFLFCDIVGNRIYPEWCAFQLGCTLVEIKTEAERRAEQAERERDIAQAENKLMRELIAGRVSA